MKVGPQGHIYLHKRIRDAFGNALRLLPDDSAGAIYPKDADPEDVIRSLKVIIQHLALRVKPRGATPIEGGIEDEGDR